MSCEQQRFFLIATISSFFLTSYLKVKTFEAAGGSSPPGAKMRRAHGGCLGAGSRRRARQAAIVPGEAQTACDPGVPEWGNPPGAMPRHPTPERIGRGRTTRGTETSKYPEEEKSTEIPRVAASESGRAQTHARVTACRRCRVGVVGPHFPPPARGGRAYEQEAPAERHGKAGRSG